MATRRPLVAALAAVLAVSFGLAGCSKGMTDAEVTGMLESEIVASVPHATGASVGLAYSGASHRTVTVNLYVDADAVTEVSTAVDAVFHTVWTSFPSMPARIGVSATLGEKPDDVEVYGLNALDPEPIAAELGLETRNVLHELIRLDNVELASRYGEWQAPEAP